MHLIGVLGNYTVPAALPPPGVTPDFQHPEDVLSSVNLVTQILAVAMVTPFVAIRLYTKSRIAPPFLTDDWICLLAWVLGTVYGGTGFGMFFFGGGHHSWDLPKSSYEGFLKALYADSVSYGPATYFTKCAILLVVARVFQPFRATYSVAFTLMVGMAGYYLPVLIIKARVCVPLEGFWNTSVPSRCFDQRAIFVADTVMSAVTDLAVLLLPIPATLSLRLPKRKRLRVWVMLGLGGVATLASFARMFLVVQLLESADNTVDFVRFNLLGTAETSIGLICACLPALSLFIFHTRGRVQELSRDGFSLPSFRKKRLQDRTLGSTLGTTFGTYSIWTGDREDITSRTLPVPSFHTGQENRTHRDTGIERSRAQEEDITHHVGMSFQLTSTNEKTAQAEVRPALSRTASDTSAASISLTTATSARSGTRPPSRDSDLDTIWVSLDQTLPTPTLALQPPPWRRYEPGP